MTAPAEAPRPVFIVPYDESWPGAFAAERARLQVALAHLSPLVEHVGSTAVPGLAAKPVIDILVDVADLIAADTSVSAVVTLGYAYYPGHEAAFPERRYFDRQEGELGYHVHLVPWGSEFWARHLAFRDYLRVHPETAAQYAALKRELAVRFRDDRPAYTDGKTAFIRRVEAMAMRDDL